MSEPTTEPHERVEPDTVWAARADLLSRSSLNGRLVVAPDSEQVSVLDNMATAILDRLTTPQTLDQLLAGLDLQFAGEASAHRAELAQFLADLESRRLVVRSPAGQPPPVPLGGRRWQRPRRPRVLRVLNLLNSDHRRGAETFGVELAGGLAANGLDVRTVAVTASGAAHTFPVPSLAHGRIPLATAVGRLARGVRDRDIMIAHGGQTLFVAAVVHLLTRRPFVYRVIGEPHMWAQRGDQRARVRLALRNASRVAVYYEQVAAGLVSTFGVDPERIVVIPKGAATERFRSVSDARSGTARERFGIADRRGPVIVYLGALSPQKNVGQVITAAAAVPDSTVLVVGDGPERPRLEALARELGTDVVFAGTSDRPDEALLAADVVALTSRTEGMPSVLIEAGLAGRPVVTSNVGGIADIVRDGETGYLVALDDTAGTAAALVKAYDQRGALGPAARNHCLARFDLTRVAKQWESLLREVAREGPQNS